MRISLGRFSKGAVGNTGDDCTDMVDGRNPKQPPGMVLKPCKYWGKLPLPQLVSRIHEPSTVWLFFC